MVFPFFLFPFVKFVCVSVVVCTFASVCYLCKCEVTLCTSVRAWKYLTCIRIEPGKSLNDVRRLHSCLFNCQCFQCSCIVVVVFFWFFVFFLLRDVRVQGAVCAITCKPGECILLSLSPFLFVFSPFSFTTFFLKINTYLQDFDDWELEL